MKSTESSITTNDFIDYLNNNNNNNLISDYDIIKKFNKYLIGGTYESNIIYYTIPEGTILYHCSISKDIFNPYNILFNDKKFITFFSTNKKLAIDYFNQNQNNPIIKGYIHKFIVRKPIDNTIVFLINKIDNDTINKMNNLNAIGFCFDNNLLINSDFAITNPNNFLEYWSSQNVICRNKSSY